MSVYFLYKCTDFIIWNNAKANRGNIVIYTLLEFGKCDQNEFYAFHYHLWCLQRVLMDVLPRFDPLTPMLRLYM